MSVYLPLVAGQLFNTPLAMHESWADMMIAAINGKFDLRDIITAAGAVDREMMAAKKAKSMPVGPQQAVDQGKSFMQAGSIAIIPVQGSLTKSGGLCTIGYDDITMMHHDALNDDSVKAIWYDINSGGGAVSGLFGLTDLIHDSSQKVNGKDNAKPIWGMAADTAYSAAYAILAACDKGFVTETGGVGSVGCITMVADASKALEMEGVAVKVLRSTPGKAPLSGIEPFEGNAAAGAAIEKLQAQVVATGNIFVDRVAKYTGLSKKAVAGTDASDYMGIDAKVIGFVNDVQSEAQAFAALMRKIA